MSALVIIPTYNECENIEKIVSVVLSQRADIEVLVVDDNSPDGTASLVKNMQKSESTRLHLLSREGKLGLGTAYIAGFKWGLKNDYDLLFEMDADFSHDPKDLNRMIAAMGEKKADVIIGSRYVPGGKLVDWPFSRWLLSYGASWYVRIITGMPIKDPTSGFICYKKEVLASLALDNIRFIGYAFQIEMKFKSYLKNFELAEIPITFRERIVGTSKMSGGIVKEAVFGVLKLRWDSFLNRI